MSSSWCRTDGISVKRRSVTLQNPPGARSAPKRGRPPFAFDRRPSAAPVGCGELRTALWPPNRPIPFGQLPPARLYSYPALSGSPRNVTWGTIGVSPTVIYVRNRTRRASRLQHERQASPRIGTGGGRAGSTTPASRPAVRLPSPRGARASGHGPGTRAGATRARRRPGRDRRQVPDRTRQTAPLSRSPPPDGRLRPRRVVPRRSDDHGRRG